MSISLGIWGLLNMITCTSCLLFEAASELRVGFRANKGVWPRRVQNPFCINIVMLHIKLKEMKRRIQWCKIFALGHVWGSLEVKK